MSRCTRLGRSSATFAFDLHASRRPVCTVETIYVHLDADGAPQPIPDEVRRVLS